MPSLTKREMTRLITRLESIYQKLDGKNSVAVNKSDDEFINCQIHLTEQIVSVRNKIQLKMKLTNKPGALIELRKIKNNLQKEMSEIDDSIDKIKIVLHSILESPKVIQKIKDEKKNILEKFEELVKQLRVAASSDSDISLDYSARNQTVKLSDLKANYKQLGQDDPQRNIFGPDEIGDEKALAQWGLEDQKLDERLGDVVILLDEIRVMNDNLGREIEIRDGVVTEANQDVEKTNKELERQNKSLADVLRKYRSPGKLCLDICLGILLLGLIAVVIMMSVNGK